MVYIYKNLWYNNKKGHIKMKVIANNKKAYFEYEILDKFEAGIVLEGSEVKSVRAGHISLLGSFIFITNGEVFLKNAFIKTYDMTSAYIPDERRSRKLLLNKSEIAKIFDSVQKKGLTCVPLKAYLTPKNLVKLEIGIGRGKKLYDKRESIKERDLKREMQRKSVRA